MERFGTVEFWPENQKMNVYVPHTELHPLTYFLLQYIPWTAIVLEDNLDYTGYFQERWDEGQTFINIEHDVAWWDGAVEEIWNCPEPYCFFGYNREDVLDCVPIGLAKISAKMISHLPGIWEAQKTEPNRWRDKNTPEWVYCDMWLYEAALKKGFQGHQHKPSIINVPRTVSM